ncbi:MAG: DUF3126 family protein [Maricaulaceae bacterium]
MRPDEIARIQHYLREKFSSPTLSVRRRKQDDSAEVYLGDEFIAVIYRDDEDPADISYAFEMAILEGDLPLNV